MTQNRITSVELHTRLGATIDRAVVEPVIITKHGRDHLVMLSAERYAALVESAEAKAPRVKPARATMRKARSA
jgi:prevent-host-death family protein